jgi:arsenate reductase
LTPEDGRKRVLFVCIGNSCRSQMAEAFARAYGADALIPASAGLAPAMSVARDTMRLMKEKNLDLRDHFPKSIRHLNRARFDLVVNMSGELLPDGTQGQILEWDVADPIRLDYEQHAEVRDEIERRVMELVLELRRERQSPALRGQGSPHQPSRL